MTVIPIRPLVRPLGVPVETGGVVASTTLGATSAATAGAPSPASLADRVTALEAELVHLAFVTDMLIETLGRMAKPKGTGAARG